MSVPDNDIVFRLRRNFFIVASLLFLLISFFLWDVLEHRFIVSITVGFIVGVCDNFIMLYGVESGSKRSIDKALSIMKKNMFKRIAFIATAFLLAIRLNVDILSLFLAFLLLHLFFLIFLIFNTWRDFKKIHSKKERGEKCV